MSRSPSLFLLIGILGGVAATIAANDAGTVKITESSDGYRVTIDGALFTAYHIEEQKSFLYPVIGPTGVNLVRDHPLVPTQSQDHPWHVGIFYALGKLNGLDFWNDRNDQHTQSRIAFQGVERIEYPSPHHARLTVSNHWTHQGETLMTDRTEMTFSGNETMRVIDYRITLIASHGSVRIGDSKEGAMGLRMSDHFRTKDRGARALSSEDNDETNLWGKPARWVSYTTDVADETLSITFFDHPHNLRYPTTWHARDYGLLAANPFGLSQFLPEQNLSGDIHLAKGQTLTFSHRLIFHRGSPDDVDLDALHAAWIGAE